MLALLRAVAVGDLAAGSLARPGWQEVAAGAVARLHTVASQWRHSGATVAPQWRHSGGMVNLVYFYKMHVVKNEMCIFFILF